MERGVWVIPPLYTLPLKDKVQRVRGDWIGSLNVCRCTTLDGKREVFVRMLLDQKFDVLELNSTKMKGSMKINEMKDEYKLGCVSGRVSGMIRGRAGKKWP